MSARGQRRIAVIQGIQSHRRPTAVLDRIEPRRTFGGDLAHFVQAAVAMV